MKDYKWFPAHELVCKCNHCDGGEMDDDFMAKVILLRSKVGPLVPTSAYRCADHNDDVAGTGKAGPHTTGRAMDVACTSSRRRFQILKAAIEIGFNRIGIGKTFIHVDDLGEDPNPDFDPDVVWVY